MARKILSLSAVLLLGAIIGCTTSPENRVAATSSADCPASAGTATDHRTGPALSDHTSRCVTRDELYATGHSGDVGTALRQTVPIIQ
jgi:hypothetical protein